eukprot:2091498-Pyramimonas_sp.AAC.1
MPRGKAGRSFGCPCLPGDGRIQSDLRMEPEALIMVSLKNLLRETSRFGGLPMTSPWRRVSVAGFRQAI